MSVRYSIFYCTIYSSKKLPNLFKWRQKLTIVIMPSSNSHSAYPKRLANTQNLHKFFFLSLEGNSFTIAFASSDCQYDNLSARGSLDLESEAEQGWGDAGIDLRSKKCRKFYHHFLFLLLLLLHFECPWYMIWSSCTLGPRYPYGLQLLHWGLVNGPQTWPNNEYYRYLKYTKIGIYVYTNVSAR